VPSGAGVLVPSSARSTSEHDSNIPQLKRRAAVAAVDVAPVARRAFFTPKALAVYLSLSERTIREMLRTGVSASYRIEGARRIDPRDVDAYLAGRRQEAA
jgi:excisionase family DNA binding protein